MTYDNYWKDRYQETWSISGKREDDIAKLIESLSGKEVKKIGLGTGSDEYLSGSAASQGYERGEADLLVDSTNIHLEVTGPLVKTVPVTAALWVRPDKIQNARTHVNEYDTWVVHCLEKENKRIIRVIHLNTEFYKFLDAGNYHTINPIIRGNQETYFEIPADDKVVKDFKVLVNYIKNNVKKE